MFKSSKTSWIGLVGGIACVYIAIRMSGDIKTFISWPSIYITLGGTLAAMILSFPPERLKTLWPVMKKAFVNEKFDFEKDIDTITNLAEITRREGLLALEDAIDKYTDDKFLKKGILLIVDGADKEQLREYMETEIYFMQQRHQKGHAMLDMIASSVTSLGLMGTYVGLIPMLHSLEDPTKLGPLMAIELVTSFYGAFFAYVIFMPMSKRLKVMSANEVTRKEFLLEGLTDIEENQNPKMIREKLVFYMISNKAMRKLVSEQQNDQLDDKPDKRKEVA